MKWRTAFIGVAIVGLAPLIYSYYGWFSHRWTPLTAPIALHPGKITLPEFKTDLHGYYDVWLAVDTTPKDFHRLDCQLGDHDFGNSCKTTPQTLYLSWELMRGGQVTQAKTYKAGGFRFTEGVIEANLGSIDGTRGATQKLIVKIDEDGADLNNANPRITVEAVSGYWEKWIILRQLSILWAGIWLIVALAMAVIMIMKRRLHA